MLCVLKFLFCNVWLVYTPVFEVCIYSYLQYICCAHVQGISGVHEWTLGFLFQGQNCNILFAGTPDYMCMHACMLHLSSQTLRMNPLGAFQSGCSFLDHVLMMFELCVATSCTFFCYIYLVTVDNEQCGVPSIEVESFWTAKWLWVHICTVYSILVL